MYCVLHIVVVCTQFPALVEAAASNKCKQTSCDNLLHLCWACLLTQFA